MYKKIGMTILGLSFIVSCTSASYDPYKEIVINKNNTISKTTTNTNEKTSTNQQTSYTSGTYIVPDEGKTSFTIPVYEQINDPKKAATPVVVSKPVETVVEKPVTVPVVEEEKEEANISLSGIQFTKDNMLLANYIAKTVVENEAQILSITAKSINELKTKYKLDVSANEFLARSNTFVSKSKTKSYHLAARELLKQIRLENGK